MSYFWAWAAGREAIALGRFLVERSSREHFTAASEAVTARAAQALETLALHSGERCPSLQCPALPACPGCPAPPDTTLAIILAIFAPLVLGFVAGRLSWGLPRTREPERPAPSTGSSSLGPSSWARLGSLDDRVVDSTLASTGSSRDPSVAGSSPGIKLRVVTPKTLKELRDGPRA